MMSIMHSRSFRWSLRIAAVVVGLLTFGVTGAMMALAQPVYPPPVDVQPEVVVEVQPGVQPGVQPAPAQGLAFTGAELTLIVLAFAALLAAGTGALIAARRRAARHAA
jgi:hypothetical protein